MRTSKPLRLSLQHRVFDSGDRYHLVVSIWMFFPCGEKRVLLPEMSMWQLLAEQLGTHAAVDECMPKPHGEVLAFGQAFAPDGAATQATSVRLQLGKVDKRLYVVGDRSWSSNGVATERFFSI